MIYFWNLYFHIYTRKPTVISRVDANNFKQDLGDIYYNSSCMIKTEHPNFVSYDILFWHTIPQLAIAIVGMIDYPYSYNCKGVTTNVSNLIERVQQYKMPICKPNFF